MNAMLDDRHTLRAMELADLDAVVAIEASAYPFPWSRGNFIDSLAAGYRAEVLAGGRRDVLGYFVAMAGVDELHLLNITVAPRLQGSGLGSRMLGELESICRSAGWASIWLEVRESNRGARALYQRRGFREVGLRRKYYPAPQGAREDAIVMSLQVKQGGLHGVD